MKKRKRQKNNNNKMNKKTKNKKRRLRTTLGSWALLRAGTSAVVTEDTPGHGA